MSGNSFSFVIHNNEERYLNLIHKLNCQFRMEWNTYWSHKFKRLYLSWKSHGHGLLSILMEHPSVTLYTTTIICCVISCFDIPGNLAILFAFQQEKQKTSTTFLFQALSAADIFFLMSYTPLYYMLFSKRFAHAFYYIESGMSIIIIIMYTHPRLNSITIHGILRQIWHKFG